MSLNDNIDALDFLITILKEHEESLNEINLRLYNISGKIEDEEVKSSDYVSDN